LRSWEARIVLGGRENKALADQIRTVTKKRFRERMARVSDAEMSAIERAIKIQLGMT
jgi:mRNA-degrading endonuclease toxin of MazEF toxin-antitoxin module